MRTFVTDGLTDTPKNNIFHSWAHCGTDGACFINYSFHWRHFDFYLAHMENAHFFIMKALTMKNQEITSYFPESEHFSWGFDSNQLYWSNEHLCKKITLLAQCARLPWFFTQYAYTIRTISPKNCF